jgi:uncharacterized membrane protein YhaH (DUF805 family)
LPWIAISVRRLHDLGKNGWFVFLNLAPPIGTVILSILFWSEGEEGENEYGYDPKTEEN